MLIPSELISRIQKTAEEIYRAGGIRPKYLVVNEDGHQKLHYATNVCGLIVRVRNWMLSECLQILTAEDFFRNEAAYSRICAERENDQTLN